MKRLQMIGVSLAAAAALVALAAATASASLPTWYECAKAPKVGREHLGNYNDKLCTEPNAEGKGKYILREGGGRDKHTRGKSHATVFHVKTWLGDATIECGSSKDSAITQEPNRVVDVESTLKKCEAFGSHDERCSSAGKKPGEVRLHAMRGELGYLDEATPEVGLKLWLESEPGGVFAEFTCGTNLEVQVSGSIIGVVQGDINTVSKPAEIVFASGEYLGTIDYEGHEFAPRVNLLGFEDELEAIGRHEAAPNVLTARLCGAYVKTVLGVECAEALAGEDQVQTSKGESLMIKT